MSRAEALLRPLLLLLLVPGLGAWSRAQLPAPPTVNISLDEDPEVRWKPLLQVFDVSYLKAAAAEVIDSTIPKWVHHALTPVVEALEDYIPQPYAGEIQGLASHFGGELSDIIMLNFAYEVTAFCTSIVAQDKNGHLFHGRNLDYPHSVLRNLTINISFLKKGEVAYTGTSFAGYVGLWTGQSPNKFTVSGDQRGSEHLWNWWKNIVSAILYRRSPVSWLVRETLEEAEDFQDAVMRLSKIPIITGVYYIVGGVRPGEGVVITRDRKGPADIWPLEPVDGGWYRVETNFDHWLPPPARDHRREAANKALNATGQEHINADTLFQVLSLYPVCNGITVYTTIMSAATPEKYSTVIRPQGCSKTD
ncbi:N-acylethanolamine-hydrolyzing acid amidase-like [Salarias fasciatus]|nr:N-acylethanolamine-hydrolyzing acid amidase-like [Salarias fasciatus]